MPSSRIALALTSAAAGAWRAAPEADAAASKAHTSAERKRAARRVALFIDADLLGIVVGDVHTAAGVEGERGGAPEGARAALGLKERPHERRARPPRPEHQDPATLEDIQMAERVEREVDRVLQLVAGSARGDRAERLTRLVEQLDRLRIAIEHGDLIEVVDGEPRCAHVGEGAEMLAGGAEPLNPSIVVARDDPLAVPERRGRDHVLERLGDATLHDGKRHRRRVP